MSQQTYLTTYFKKPRLNQQHKEGQNQQASRDNTFKHEPPERKIPPYQMTSCCHRRLISELKWYKEEQDLSPWLPDIVPLDEDQLDILECQFAILHHQPFMLRIEVVSDYPFKPLVLHAQPMPDELYECALNNKLFLFHEDHSPSTRILHIIMTIWSIVTENDHEIHDSKHQDPTWKGKTKVQYKKSLPPSSTPVYANAEKSETQPQNSLAGASVAVETTRRKKLPVIERIMFQQKLRDQASEAQFEEDLQKALAASVVAASD